MGKTTIEWSESVWNPITGCTKVSPGCKHCYAETFYERFHGKGSFKNIICHEDRLDIPIKTKKPTVFFVNSMSDLFHEKIDFEFIDKVYWVMMNSPQHTFQVLTKRARQMMEYYSWKEAGNGWGLPEEWPLKNVWVGVSAENQEELAGRLSFLFVIPAVVKWLSCEPLLGPLDLSATYASKKKFSEIPNWIVVGGESGPGARIMNPTWVKDIRDQCGYYNIPFFFKQWGAFNEEGRRVGKKKAGRLLDGVLYSEYPKQAR